VSSALRPLDYARPYLDDVAGLRLGIAARLRSWVAVHARSLALLGVLLPLAGVLHAVGMYRSPGLDVNADEGTYVSQAWAVDTWHQLSHYTYWYDHPPLGWMQLAAWMRLTDGWARAPFAVAAGREFMLVVDVVSCALLFVLARHLRASRVAAAAAVVLFAASPLALHMHRMVWLDGIGTAWLLAALVFATSPRRSLAAAVGSALCLTAAVLTKETLAVLAPIVLAVLWQHSDVRTRRYRICVFATLSASLILFYPLYAFVKDELFEGPGHVSLIWAIRWQLALRRSSGWVLDEGSDAWGLVQGWLHLDAWLLGAGVVAAVPALWSRRLRVVAVALLLQVAMMLRPGYLPAPYVVAMLPFAALLAALVPDAALRAARAHPVRRLLVALPVAAVCVLAAPSWLAGNRAQVASPHEVPMRAAVQWVRANIPRDAHVLVDDNVWLDMVRAGYPVASAEPSVLLIYKLGTDPSVKVRSIDWFVYATDPMSAAREIPQVVDPFRRSQVVATFGSGENRITVRRVVPAPSGTDALLDPTAQSTSKPPAPISTCAPCRVSSVAPSVSFTPARRAKPASWRTTTPEKLRR
jgi:hypothetical protein